MNLTGLSLQRCGRYPHAPDNTERRRAWDAAKPGQPGNGYDWKHCQAARYAREQMQDHPARFTGNYADLSHGY